MKSESGPTVSVIIPTYNRADILTRAIDSVLEQTFSDFELFVVDDASTDETPDVVDAYTDERIVYLRHNENCGNGGIARNTALDRVNGDYVAFLDDDDVWKPTKLEKQVELLDSASDDVGLVYCWMDYYDGDDVVERRHPRQRGDIFREMLDSNAITNASTLLVRSDVIRDVGVFDANLDRGIDSDFIRRVAREYAVDYVPEVLVQYNVGHGYDRDTSTDEAGVRAAIESTEAKFKKFPDAFDRYPAMRASNLAYIGRQYCMIGEWTNGLGYFKRALSVKLTTWRVYFQMASTVKFYVDRYVPSIGRAIDDRMKL